MTPTRNPKHLDRRALDRFRVDGHAAAVDGPERRLVSAARRGDPAALRQLMERLSRPVLRFGQGFCRNADDAADLAQDVLRTLLAELPRFRGDSSLSTWAFTVARRACVRRRIRERRMLPLDAGPGLHEHRDPSATPDVVVERRQLGEAIERALATLEPAHREVVMLRDVEGLPAAEVAKVLGIGERAVKSRLHRARLELRAALEPYVGHRATPARRSPGPRTAGVPGAAAAVAATGRCPDTARLLSRYLEGDLDARVCDTLSAHVAHCERCDAVCASLREVLGACRRWGAAPLPAGERARVRAAVREAVAGLTNG